MIRALLRSVHEFFRPNPQSDLEAFIVARNPTTPAEVDFWTREYDNRRRMASRLESEGQHWAARRIMHD